MNWEISQSCSAIACSECALSAVRRREFGGENNAYFGGMPFEITMGLVYMWNEKELCPGLLPSISVLSLLLLRPTPFEIDVSTRNKALQAQVTSAWPLPAGGYFREAGCLCRFAVHELPRLGRLSGR